MTKMTVTEALAELKTIKSRIEKKRAFIKTLLFRSEQMRDPMEKDGGSKAVIKQELQSISDLETRYVDIRCAIQEANSSNKITINKIEKTIAEWIYWRREVSENNSIFLYQINDAINRTRNDVLKKGQALVGQGEAVTKPTDILVNIDEKELSENIESLTDVLGILDGQLSLKNATIFVDV